MAKRTYERGSSVTFRIPKYKPCSQKVITFLNTVEENSLNSEIINAIELYIKYKDRKCIEPGINDLKKIVEIKDEEAYINNEIIDSSEEIFSENKNVVNRSYPNSINRAINSIRKV